MGQIPVQRFATLEAAQVYRCRGGGLHCANRPVREIQDPQRWYPLVGGNVEQFNDLPVNLRGNVIQSAPFGLQPGAPPRLSAADAADLVAFLRTSDPAYRGHI